MLSSNLSDLENRLSYLDEADQLCSELVDSLNHVARAVAETDPARAQSLSKRALQVATQLRYRQGEARALTLMAWVNMVEGRVDLALTRALNAEAVARLARDAQLEGHALYTIALIHDQVGNFAEAHRTRQKMIVVARELDDEILEANCLLTMGMQHSRNTEFKKAMGYYMQALTLYRKQNDDSERHALALNNVASALTDTGDVLLALQYAQKALNRCDRNNRRVHALIVHTFGYIYAAMGQFDEALTHYMRSSALNVQDGQITDHEFEVTVQLDLAKMQRAMTQPKQAFMALQQALEIAQAIDAKPLLAQTHDQLSKAYRETGQVALALAHAEQREAIRALIHQTTSTQHEKVIRVMAILQASRKHVHTEQCQAAHEWLWQACLHGNAPTC